MENTKLRASQKYKKRSTFDSIWRQLRKNKGAIVGMILLVVIIIIALVSPYIFNYETDVIANNVKERMQHPSSEHWFGTDDLGRDIFARVCYGARYSLAVGLVAVAVALVVGVTLGAAAGYVGGVFENLIMRVCDIFSSIPSVLMAIAVVSALGKSTFNLMLAVGIASTAPFIRVARAAVLTVRGEEYVESARAIGSPEWKIVAFHILPNCVSQIIVQATLRVGSAIISAAQLSFLGLGVAQAVHQIAPGVKVDHHAAQVKHDTFIHTSCLALFRVVGEQLQYTTTRRCFSTAFCMDAAWAA